MNARSPLSSRHAKLVLFHPTCNIVEHADCCTRLATLLHHLTFCYIFSNRIAKHVQRTLRSNHLSLKCCGVLWGPILSFTRNSFRRILGTLTVLNSYIFFRLCCFRNCFIGMIIGAYGLSCPTKRNEDKYLQGAVVVKFSKSGTKIYNSSEH